MSRSPFCRHVRAVLVQRQAGGAAGSIGLKGNLGVDHFVEEIPLALRKNLDLGLAGGLGKELIAFAGDSQDEVRGQLVLADVSVKDLRIDGNLLVLLGRGRSPSIRFARQVMAVLVQGQAGGTAAGIGLEGNLRIDNLVEEIPLASPEKSGTWAGRWPGQRVGRPRG